MKARATIHVHGELADHLPFGRGGRPLVTSFALPVGLRDLVQSTGIPHVEVGRVEVDGVAAWWDRSLDGDVAAEVWPRYPLPHPDPDPRFLLDVHLGKLARLLRLLGLDAVHRREAEDDDLAREAASSGRILLTRDRGLLMRGALSRGRWIRATDPEEQAAEVLAGFRLDTATRPFSRCMECNTPVTQAPPDTVDVPAGVRSRHRAFRYCPGCGRVYWPGTHAERLAAAVGRILGAR